MKHLEEFKKFTGEEIFEQRKEKFLSIGKQKSFKVFSDQTNWFVKDNFFAPTRTTLFKFKKELIIVILLIFVVLLFLF